MVCGWLDMDTGPLDMKSWLSSLLKAPGGLDPLVELSPQQEPMLQMLQPFFPWTSAWVYEGSNLVYASLSSPQPRGIKLCQDTLPLFFPLASFHPMLHLFQSGRSDWPLWLHLGWKQKWFQVILNCFLPSCIAICAPHGLTFICVLADTSHLWSKFEERQMTCFTKAFTT